MHMVSILRTQFGFGESMPLASKQTASTTLLWGQRAVGSLFGGLHLVLGGLTVAELCQTDGCDEEDLLGQGHLLRGPHRSSRRIGELMAHVIMVLRIISLVLSSVRPHTRSLDIKVGCFFFSRQAGQGIMLALIRGGHSSFFVIHS